MREQLAHVLLVDGHRVLARELGRTCRAQGTRVNGIVSNHGTLLVLVRVSLCVIWDFVPYVGACGLMAPLFLFKGQANMKLMVLLARSALWRRS